MNKTAVILAGGAGMRAGGMVPKQFRTLGGEPMLFRPVTAFVSVDPATRIIIAVNPRFITEWTHIISDFAKKRGIKCEIVAGGNSRRESVANALNLVADGEGMLAVHDAARPLLSESMIRRGWEACDGERCAVPVVPVTDSIRKIEGSGSRSVDRSLYRAVQTPQVFPARILKKAYKEAGEGNFTDDASIVEAAGERITLYEGDPENIKVTNPADFAIAEAILAEMKKK